MNSSVDSDPRAEAGIVARTMRPSTTTGEREVLSLSRRERFLLAALVLVTVIALAGSFFAVRGLLSSPEQRAAQAAPLGPLIVTAPVQQEHRQEAVTLEAVVTYPDSLPVAPPGAGEGPAILVEMRVAPGDALSSGDLIAEISGRPLIAMEGDFPLYRDLTRDDAGKDVAALQTALADLGYLHGAVDGVFGTDTEQAVLALLADRGYPATIVQSTEPVEPAVQTPEETAETAGSEAADVESAGETAAVDETASAGATGARTRTVTTVPRTLFSMIDVLPTTVLTVPVEVGDDLAATETLLTLSPSVPVVRGRIATTQAFDITEGMPVTFTVDGTERAGTVQSIVESGEEDGLSVLTVIPEEPLAKESVGASVSLTVVTASTDGEVLTVPIGAIRSDASAHTYVLVAAGEETRQVPVTVEHTVDGAAVLTEDTDLETGDEVLLGGERS